jgi:hypothetical protein
VKPLSFCGAENAGVDSIRPLSMTAVNIEATALVSFIGNDSFLFKIANLATIETPTSGVSPVPLTYKCFS